MQNIKPKPKDIRESFLAFLLVFIIICPVVAQTGKKGLILFYNPETNINNFASLKGSFDKFLSEHGNFQFQPFNRREIFEDKVEKIDTSSFVVASSWLFRSLNKNRELKPLLIAVRDGKFTFKKTLFAMKPISKIEEMKGKTLASSGSKEYTLSLLKDMVGKNKADLLSDIKILTVSKDIDALMSVSFGVAQAAITTEASLQQIKQVNPKLKEKLIVLLNSGEILMPIVSCGNKEDSKDISSELTKILTSMDSTKNGRDKLAELSMDKWIAITPEIMEMLNK